MIKIYIQPNCANCKLLKTLFNNKKIKYEEIFDNEYLIKNGFKSTPIVNDGEFLNFIDAYTKYKNYKGGM
jgi:glutaredoxin